MSSPLTVIYEFDRFRLDRGNQRLTRDGLLIATPGKTFGLLVMLIENREQAVSIQKLVTTFYPKSGFGEEELTTDILALKRLLDDTSKRAPIIRTIMGQGYQFEAEVTEYVSDSDSGEQYLKAKAEEEVRAAAAAKAAALKQPSGGLRKVILGGAIAAVVLVVLGIGIWQFSPMHGSAGGGGLGSIVSGGSGASGSGDVRVAVLPFQSLTGEAGDDRFNDTLTEAIIKALSKHVSIVPEASVRQFLKTGAPDPVTAGRELGAQMIVRGMAQRLAGHILVKVQLISAEDGSQIWSNGFEGDSNDIAGLSSQISQKIGKGIPAAQSGQP